jgi:hypothetical protein
LRIASIITGTYLWNVSLLLHNYKAPYPKRLASSYSTSWEPEISTASSDHSSYFKRKRGTIYVRKRSEIYSTAPSAKNDEKSFAYSIYRLLKTGARKLVSHLGTLN